MVRIKVIKASQLLFWVLLVLAVLVAAVVLIRFAPWEGMGAGNPAAQTSAPHTVVMQEKAAAQVVAAAFSSALAQSEQKTGIEIEVVLSPGGEKGAQNGDKPSDAGLQNGEAADGHEMHEDEATDPQAPPITIEILPSERQTAPPTDVPARQMRILIYHTHTHEAYEQVKGKEYVETTKWRTADAENSIVRVGEELTRQLTGMGFLVVHDKTDHEPPKLGTAYTRSLKTLEGYKDRGEVFDLYIDLHRDAYVEGVNEAQTVKIDGQEVARLMLLIGNGKGQGSVIFAEKPNYVENAKLAQRLTDSLNQIKGDFCKPVMLKTGRYNQHISEKAVLVEVGNNKNTLVEALSAMPYLAKAIGQVLR